MKSKAGQQKGFLRIVTFPFRALGKVKDFYVKRIISCSDKFGQGTLVMGMPSSNYAPSLPRSFSVNSAVSDDNNDDLRDLIRAASTRSLPDKFDMNNLYDLQQLMIKKQQMSKLVNVNGTNVPKGMPPRSCSVGMGKIDEEKPSVFGDDFENVKPKETLKLPRSRSHAVNGRSVLV